MNEFKTDKTPPLNSYEQKQADKKERLQEAANKARRESNTIYTATKRKASMIPFGQPILNGHHSERRDRNFRNSISRGFGKAFALDAKASHYDQKAASVGTGGVSSDDPDAVKKLTVKLKQLEADQSSMKTINALIRKNNKAGIVALGYTEEQADDFFKKDFAGRIGYPSYRLRNNNANIKQVKERLSALQNLADRASVEQVGSGYIYKEDPEENRIMFIFEGKPAQQVRDILANHAFRWSPNRDGKPWVRKLSNNGLWAAKQVREALERLATEADSEGE